MTVVIDRIASDYNDNNGPEKHIIAGFRVLEVSGGDNGSQYPVDECTQKNIFAGLQ